MHNLASSEGLRQLPGLRSLSVSPQPGSALVLEGLPHLVTLSLDLSSCGSSSRELVRRSAVAYVPLGGAALPALRNIELRCFMWGRPPMLQPHEALPGQHGAVDEPLVEDGEGAEDSGGDSDDDGDNWSGSDDEAAEFDEEQGAPNSESDDDDEEPSDDEGWEPAGPGEEAAAAALARLERAYLSALLTRLPALESVQLSDYLGVVAPPSSSKASGGGSGLGASRAARAGGADGGWRDATGCTIAGAAWQRAVSQTPARDDGAPLCDVRYMRL